MKKIKIIIIILNFLLSFPIHFGFSMFPSFITSIIFPVNESVWEHMKILVLSILISSIIEIIIYKKINYKTNNFLISNVISSLFGIVFYLFFYYLISICIPHNFIVTISLMLITYIVSQIVSYNIMRQKKIPNQNKLGIILILIIYIMFTHLTYYPPNTELFRDSTNNSYGIY